MKSEDQAVAFGRVFGAALTVASEIAEAAGRDASYVQPLFACKKMIACLTEVALKSVDARASA